MYTGSITIPRRVCVWVIYTENRDLPRWSFSDVPCTTTWYHGSPSRSLFSTRVEYYDFFQFKMLIHWSKEKDESRFKTKIPVLPKIILISARLADVAP